MSERTRALVISGPFDDWELELFAKLMRDIERSKPGQTFVLAVHDAEGQGLEEAIKLVDALSQWQDKGRIERYVHPRTAHEAVPGATWVPLVFKAPTYRCRS